jgi:uncharacterized protein (DUF1778 family)
MTASKKNTESRSERIFIRVTESEKKALQQYCKSEGVTVTDIVRKAISEELKKGV